MLNFHNFSLAHTQSFPFWGIFVSVYDSSEKWCNILWLIQKVLYAFIVSDYRTIGFMLSIYVDVLLLSKV